MLRLLWGLHSLGEGHTVTNRQANNSVSSRKRGRRARSQGGWWRVCGEKREVRASYRVVYKGPEATART